MAEKKKRTDLSRSYRFDPETVALIDQLAKALRDPQTDQPRSATDVLRQGVRVLAKKYLPDAEK